MPPVPVADLPFLLVHGAWVWKVLIVLAIAIAIGVQVGVRWRRARREARGDAREWVGRTTAIGDGDVVVRATVRGGVASSLAVGETRFHHRDAGLRFESGGEPIAVDGDIDVRHGSRAQTGRIGLPRATPAPVRAAIGDVAAVGSVLRTVRDGDEVVLSGKVSHAPATEGAGYRDGAKRWTIGGPKIEVIAVRPASGAAALTMARIFATIVMVGGLSGYLMYKIGGWTEKRARSADRSLPPAIDELNAYTVAAMMPGSRDEAIARLDFAYRRPTSDAELGRAAAIARLHHGCAGPAQTFEDAERYDLQLEHAAACRDHGQVLDAAVKLGRYDRAAEAAAAARATGATSPFRYGLAFIGAGRWAEAAVEADGYAASIEADASGELEYRASRLARAGGYRCFAAQFRVWAGDAAARADVVRAATAGNDYCRILAVATEPADQRVAALRAVGAPAGEDVGWRLRELVPTLLWAAGGTTEPDRYDDAVPYELRDVVEGGRAPDRMWFAPFAAAAFAGPIQAGSTDPATRIAAREALLWSAALETYRGHPETALLDVARAGPLLPPGEEGEGQRRDLTRFADAISLHTPATGLHWSDRQIDRDVALRAGEMFDEDAMVMGAYPRSCEPDMKAAVTAAIGGDGLPLARILRECAVYWITMPETIRDVLPRVTLGRAELAAALRHFHADLDDPPFYFLQAAAMHRTHLRLAGDDAGADWWQAIIDRHLAVLADPDRLLALVLWTN